MPWECARPVDRPPAPPPLIRTQDSSPLIYAAKPGAVKGLAIGRPECPAATGRRLPDVDRPIPILPENRYDCCDAPVAQLDRASVFGTEGWEFEPLRAYWERHWETSAFRI
jgi:hypothetical protein